MIEIIGKHTSAKIFTDVVDDVSISQVYDLCNLPYMEGRKVRMMSDIHAGAGCTIGTTFDLNTKVVCPNIVGVDISCGMITINLGKVDIDLERFDTCVKETVPAGFDVHDKVSILMKKALEDIGLENLKCYKSLHDVDRIEKSLGTLGGGNHFIELDKSGDGTVYLVIHSGSRNLGKQVADYYQKKAIEHCGKERLRKESEKVITQLKSEGREKEISKALENLKKNFQGVSSGQSYIEDDDFNDYLHDADICKKYSQHNRSLIAMAILTKYFGSAFLSEEVFETIHNYIDTENMIVRKGAVSAQVGEKLLIPINMRDGSLICVGKGNPDWNYSAPHGAGRIMSRNEAKEVVSLDDFKESMQGIYSSTINESTIDESPFAYKKIEDIVDNIGDTVEIVDIIKPIYNFKGY